VKVVQLVPTLHQGDAIGNNAIAIRNFLVSRDIPTIILYLEADPEIAHEGLHISHFPEWNASEILTILHFALPSPLTDLFKKAKGKRILVYHNVTPPTFLTGYPQYQRLAVVAREELKGLKTYSDLAIADSEFNRLELEGYGFSDTRVTPIFIDFSRYNQRSNPVLARMFRDDFINFLFVGRITPNKCQHDLIRLYGYYKRFVRERSRLFIVGKWDGFEPYYYQLNHLIKTLKLADVYVPGHVDFSELVTYYRISDVFISMSEHEGFGVPLLESMYFDLPVFAYRAAAVPHTLGGSGILFGSKDRMRVLSEFIELVVTEKSIHEAIIANQRHRMEDFSRKNLENDWERILTMQA